MLCIGLSQAIAQTTAAGDPLAIALAADAMKALTGGSPIRDVTLTGGVTWNGKQSGTVTLKALGAGESSINLVLQDRSRTELRDAQTGTPLGQWATPKGSGAFAFHNCQTDAAWFFPALGSLKGGTKTVLSYVGQEIRNGQSVQHLKSYIYQASPPSGLNLAARLSTMDFYLDAASSLPTALVFNDHPDKDALVNIPVEIDFSDYQQISGMQVPMHIQKLMNGTLLLDITLTGAVFNTGLALTEFSVNQ